MNSFIILIIVNFIFYLTNIYHLFAKHCFSVMININPFNLYQTYEIGAVIMSILYIKLKLRKIKWLSKAQQISCKAGSN